MLTLRLGLIVAIPACLALAGAKLAQEQRGDIALAIKFSLALTAVVCSLAAIRLIDQPPLAKLAATAFGGAVLGFIWNFTLTLFVWSFGPIVAFGLLIAIVGALVGMLTVVGRDSSADAIDILGCTLGTLTALTVNALRPI